MRKLLIIPTLLFCCITMGQDIPSPQNPPKLVNDFANLLTPEQEQALEQKLVAYADSTTTQIAVVIVEDLGGYEPVEYAVKLGRTWGVGGKEFSNGIVILISIGGGEGKRDAFIATGYGMEGVIPDVTADAIVENDIVPNFRAGNYYRGLDEATDNIIRAAAGEYKAPPGERRGRRGVSLGGILMALILLLIIFSGGGRRGGGTISRRGYGGFPAGWIIGNILGSLGSGGRGGGWSGGGGFGGFGGGGFGGGGAGGKW
ncbi:MAG TPA: TPM domain-containing protein [Chitinophagaceae bacterium]|nr:TPM domain-containing protein [Chitinophagaceae bacterium]